MYPEDRVLVVYVPHPSDFSIIRDEGWYRIPQKNAPKGLHAEYFAFYFGRRFGAQKWAIHYYAAQLGHELVTRAALLPADIDHPRADNLYYKVQLGPLQELDRPILSIRWRRITFLHTTWDRFQDAAEINDLLIVGGDYVDRLFAALRERGAIPGRTYRVEETDMTYQLPLKIQCQRGQLEIGESQLPRSEWELRALLAWIDAETLGRGGLVT
jgi:hypothetical protein